MQLQLSIHRTTNIRPKIFKNSEFGVFNHIKTKICSNISQIRNGDGPTSPLIARYCGSSIPPPVISTSNQLWLKFGSDGSVANHGFRALYRVDLEGGINGGNIPDGDSEVTEHANTTNNNTATCKYL